MASSAPFASEVILRLASTVRSDGAVASFCFGTGEKPFNTGHSSVYAVKFPDDTTWAVQVFAGAATSLTAESLSSFVGAQATTLTKLEKAGFRWSPKLIHHDTGYDNLLKHPYLVLSWFPGKRLEWTDTVPSNPQDRQKILRQVVNIQLELAQRTQESRPGSSSLAFLMRMVDGQIGRAATGQEPLLGVRDCLVHRALVRHVADDSLDSEPPILAISHESLAAHNIIVDDDYNIKGIVGWSFARTLPLQLAFRLPRFLAVEPDSPGETAAPPPADISGFAKQYLQAPPAILADRGFVLRYLASIISDPNKAVHHPLANLMVTVLANLDIDWQYLVIEACFSKGLHAWMANRGWLLHGTKMRSDADVTTEKLVHELEEFLKVEGENREIMREALMKVVKG